METITGWVIPLALAADCEERLVGGRRPGWLISPAPGSAPAGLVIC